MVVPPQGVLAVIEGVAITTDDILPLLLIEAPLEVDAAIRDRVLARLVEVEARARGVNVDSAAIDARTQALLDEQAARVRGSVEGSLTFEDFVRGRFGIEPDSYRGLVRRKVRETWLLERLVRHQALLEDRYVLRVLLAEDRATADELASLLAEGASFRRPGSGALQTSDGRYRWTPAPAAGFLREPAHPRASALAPGELAPVSEIRQGDDSVFRILKLETVLPGRERTWAACAREVEEELGGVQSIRWNFRPGSNGCGAATACN